MSRSASAEGSSSATPRALDRLAQVDLLVVVDHPGIERPELRMAAIDTRSSEIDGLIQLAASIGRHLSGERGPALAAASQLGTCRS